MQTCNKCINSFQCEQAFLSSPKRYSMNHSCFTETDQDKQRPLYNWSENLSALTAVIRQYIDTDSISTSAYMIRKT